MGWEASMTITTFYVSIKLQNVAESTWNRCLLYLRSIFRTTCELTRGKSHPTILHWIHYCFPMIMCTWHAPSCIFFWKFSDAHEMLNILSMFSINSISSPSCQRRPHPTRATLCLGSLTRRSWGGQACSNESRVIGTLGNDFHISPNVPNTQRKLSHIQTASLVDPGVKQPQDKTESERATIFVI